MDIHRLLKLAAFAWLVASLCPQTAYGYVGPGTGMSAVGVFLAVVMGLVAAVFGFLWYPLKRLARTCRKWMAGKKGEPAA